MQFVHILAILVGLMIGLARHVGGLRKVGCFPQVLTSDVSVCGRAFGENTIV
jgi:hypothetical protein